MSSATFATAVLFGQGRDCIGGVGHPVEQGKQAVGGHRVVPGRIIQGRVWGRICKRKGIVYFTAQCSTQYFGSGTVDFCVPARFMVSGNIRRPRLPCSGRQRHGRRVPGGAKPRAEGFGGKRLFRPGGGGAVALHI